MGTLPTHCPFTGGPIIVTQFYSPEGDITIKGRFQVQDSFLALTSEQIAFVLTFIQCEGKFNRMQEELNLSYPTLRSRLKDIILALGLKEPSSVEYEAVPDRRAILAQIDAGQLTVSEALDAMRTPPEPLQSPTG